MLPDFVSGFRLLGLCTHSLGNMVWKKRERSSAVLYDDLVEEILSWLPVKCLIRLKCVCRSWNSSISNPSFIKLHLRKSAANDNLSHLRLMPNIYFESFPQVHMVSCTVSSLFHSRFTAGSSFKDIDLLTISLNFRYGLPDTYLMVVGSCNGLHCAVGNESEGFYVRFWNTATRLLSARSPCFSRISYLGTKFGFGYDPLGDNYKVVAVSLASDDSPKTEVKVYGMGDRCWRNLQGFPALCSLPKDGGVYLSGTFNWVVSVKDAANDELVIMSIDLGKETCRLLLMPGGLSCVELTFGVLGDSLCVWHDNDTTHFVIWQMSEFGDDESWIQLVNVSYSYLQFNPCEFHLHPLLLPLYMSKNGDVLMLSSTRSKLRHKIKHRTILYNKRDGKLECSSLPSSIFYTYLTAFNFKIFAESLVMPYSNKVDSAAV